MGFHKEHDFGNIIKMTQYLSYLHFVSDPLHMYSFMLEYIYAVGYHWQFTYKKADFHLTKIMRL
jgi:hypothetical protein